MIEPAAQLAPVAQRSAAQRQARRRGGSPRCRRPTRWRSRRRRSSSSPSFPGARRDVGPGPGRGAAAHRRAARAGPRAADAAVHDELPEEHRRRVAAVARGVRSRQGVHRGLPGRAARRAIRAPTTSAGARCCPGCWCASRTTRASTASSGCSATATGFRRSGANSTSSTNSRGCAAGSASSWSSAPATFSRPGVSLEQEYLKTLLLMRLDSGNFTPDQVEWVARQLEDWAPSLTLDAAAGRGRDASSSTSPARRDCAGSDRPHTGGRVLFLDASPVYARIVERMRWLPEQDDEVAEAGRAAGARAAAAADAARVAVRPRRDRAGAARRALPTDGDVRVVVGLQALTRAVAEIERLPDAARTPGVAASYDEVTQMVEPDGEPGVGRAADSRHDVEDGRSQRDRLPAASRRRRRRRRSWARSSRSRTATRGRSRSCAGCSASRSTRSRSASRSSPGAWCGCCCAAG